MAEKRDNLCPNCELGVLTEKIENLKFTYKGATIVFPNETTFTCTRCAFKNLSKESSERIDRELAIFRKKGG